MFELYKDGLKGPAEVLGLFFRPLVQRALRGREASLERTPFDGRDQIRADDEISLLDKLVSTTSGTSMIPMTCITILII